MDSFSMVAYKERINVAPWKISPDPDLCISKGALAKCTDCIARKMQNIIKTHIFHWSTLSRAQDILALSSGAHILYIMARFSYIMVYFGIVWWWSLSQKSNGSAKRRLRFIGCTKRQPKSLNIKKAMPN